VFASAPNASIRAVFQPPLGMVKPFTESLQWNVCVDAVSSARPGACVLNTSNAVTRHASAPSRAVLRPAALRHHLPTA
jgi:hypothetical protein